MRICVCLAILGLAAGTAEKPADGLGLTVDADGILHENKGIAPERSLQVFGGDTDLFAAHSKALEALVEIIRTDFDS